MNKIPVNEEHRALLKPLLALNGLILPAANLCCAEKFLPLSVINDYCTFILVFSL